MKPVLRWKFIALSICVCIYIYIYIYNYIDIHTHTCAYVWMYIRKRDLKSIISVYTLETRERKENLKKEEENK